MLAGLIVIVLSKFGITISTEEVSFFLGAAISLGFTVYSYVNRYKKGDLTLGGFKKY
jgi:hypothetical protein